MVNGSAPRHLHMAARPPFALDSYYNAPSTLSIRKQTIALDMMKRRTAAMAAAVRNLTMLDTKLQRLVDSRAISSATTSYSAPMYPPAGAGVAPMPGTAWIVGPTGQLQPLPYAMPPQVMFTLTY